MLMPAESRLAEAQRRVDETLENAVAGGAARGARHVLHQLRHGEVLGGEVAIARRATTQLRRDDHGLERQPRVDRERVAEAVERCADSTSSMWTSREAWPVDVDEGGNDVGTDAAECQFEIRV